MRTRTKLFFVTAATLFVLFRIGISSSGQRYLIGTPAADHWQRDDQDMGAGLAPYVYCLAPGLILTIVGALLFFADRKRPSTRT